MPITVDADIRRFTQEEFARVAYGVMETIFAVHNAMGRFFSEEIYRDTIARRLEEARTEVRIEVRFEDFVKEYFMDLLVSNGAVFELKTATALTAKHRSQLLNYLLLAGLSHGKLVNLRPEIVEHEFVNTSLTRGDCTRFDVDERNWREVGHPSRPIVPWFVGLLREVGAALDLQFYEDAVTHLLGGERAVVNDVDVYDGSVRVGRQRTRLAASGWSFKVTALDRSRQSRFAMHLRRFLDHTPLDGVQWINVTREQLTFTTVGK